MLKIIHWAWLAVAFGLGMMALAWHYSADAAEAKWTGCYGGVQGGYTMAAHDTTLSTPALGGASVNIDSLSAEDVAAGIVVGCDLQVTERVVFGLMGDYSWRDLEQGNTLSIGGGAITAGTDFALEDSWSIGARAGVLLNPQTLAYLLVAYHETDVSDLTVFLNTPGPSGSVSFDVDQMTGWAFGGGLEAEVMPGFYLRGEYRYLDYDDETIALAPGLLDLDLDTTEHIARVGLVYKFGLGGMPSLKD